jgi:hypothetical protein
MRAAPFDEISWFRTIHEGGARALLIGRILQAEDQQ